MLPRTRKHLCTIFLLAIVITAFSAVCGMAEGNSSVIEEIRIAGRQHSNENDAVSVLSARPGMEATEEIVQKDMQSLYALGFYSDVQVSIAQGKKGKIITYHVRENPPIKEIHFEGCTTHTPAQLQNMILTKPGSMFNRLFFDADIKRLTERLQAAGYSLTTVQDVQYQDGMLYVYFNEPKFNDLIVQGNKYTKTAVIARRFPIKKGAVFNAQPVNLGVARLRETGIFADINVGFQDAPEKPGFVDVIINVLEQKTGIVNVSASYGNDNGASYGASYKELNVGGKARVAEISASLGDNKGYRVAYVDPFATRNRVGWDISLYHTDNDDLTYKHYNGKTRFDAFDYREKKTGATVAVSKPLSKKDDKWSISLITDYHKSKDTFKGPAGNLSRNESLAYYNDIVGGDGKGVLDSKVFSTTLMAFYNGLKPNVPYTQGVRFSASLEHAWKFLGADWDYTKYMMEFAWYVPIKLHEHLHIGTAVNPVVFAGRVRAGGSSEELPFSEQYVLGGSNSLRGYDSGDFKGDEMFLANAELRVPITRDLSIVGFYDIGNAWSKKLGTSFSLSDLEGAGGVGIRVRTPMGRVRLDVAHGNETRYNFGFGEMF